MIRHIAIGAVGAALIVIVASMAGLIPVGTEVLEVPWQILASLVFGIVIGASVGFVWLDSIQRDSGTEFPWQLLVVAFAAGGICAVEWMNTGSVYYVVILVSGGVCFGALLGGAVRSL